MFSGYAPVRHCSGGSVLSITTEFDYLHPAAFALATPRDLSTLNQSATSQVCESQKKEIIVTETQFGGKDEKN